MDKNNKHSALDDYFSSMLSVPVVEEVKLVEPAVVLAKPTHPEPVPLLSVVAPQALSNFKIPEPDSAGSLTELDQLLGSVIDIDLADMDLSVLDTVEPVDLPVNQGVVETVELDIGTVEQVVDAVEPVVDTVNTIVDTGTAKERATELKSSEDSTGELDVPAQEIIHVEEDVMVAAEAPPAWENIELEEHFQALFFEVAGVIFAVPLTELGGIHQVDTVNSLFGKPDWYLGIIQHRDQKLSVVDTAQWVMPEQNMGAIDYKYQIQLSDSNWVLGCESLHGTETLNRNDIKWRSTPGSRPWLAGMVKSRMCVLLHVTEMIKLLDNGINIHGQ
ncbi:chemotaxis protein CheW [Moritella dasanensis]|uniref:chemotaxis protein CheW n=1 Tax=Moritella dasanensis TaxID=428031 RepID=UPI0002F3C6C0|nr:chemotaxis protein CheW [Moritella dasanensis]